MQFFKKIRHVNFSVKELIEGAVIAAVYAVLTLVLAPISFSAVQFRVSEALTMLPMLFPSAVPGLFVGCFLSNLLAGAPWQDVVFGSLATLAAAFMTMKVRKMPWLAAFMPVAFNGVVIGLVLHYAYGLPLLMSAATVAIGEAAVVYMLGLPLIKLVKDRVLKK